MMFRSMPGPSSPSPSSSSWSNQRWRWRRSSTTSWTTSPGHWSPGHLLSQGHLWSLVTGSSLVLICHCRMSGGEPIGFNNSVFLAEVTLLPVVSSSPCSPQLQREHADRNYALAYQLKEYGCFPEGTKIKVPPPSPLPTTTAIVC